MRLVEAAKDEGRAYEVTLGSSQAATATGHLINHKRNQFSPFSAYNFPATALLEYTATAMPISTLHHHLALPRCVGKMFSPFPTHFPFKA